MILFLFLFLPWHTFGDEEILVKRVYDHLIIRDETSALKELELALETYPDSKKLKETQIKVYAQTGHEKEMIESWKQYEQLFPEEEMSRDLVGTMASQVIIKGSNSSSPLIRIFSIIASSLANDKDSIKIILQGLGDNNSIVRSAAAAAASGMRDAKICDKILQLINIEKDWQVRLAAIEAAGKMQILEAKDPLLTIASNQSISAEERAAAVIGLVELLNQIERNQLEQLAKSDRFALRILSAALIEHLLASEHLDLLIELLNDSNAEVRKSALHALGNLRPLEFKGKSISSYAFPLLEDPDREVAILAAWLVILYEPSEVKKLFKPWLDHNDGSIRILAAAVLAGAGKYGFPFTLEAFEKSQDTYVKMTLGLALVTHRISEEKGLNALYVGLKTLKNRIMIKDFGSFEAFAPSDIKQKTFISNYPEVINQMTRLQVINTLAIMRFPKAKQAILEFIEDRSWGITGFSAALLLTECDEKAIDIVRGLLKNESSKVQMQAALILALWGKDPEAISTLISAYPTSSREIKEQILEGMGRIGDPKTIPFLVDKLDESFQSLRIIAASSILECLYH